MSCNNRSDCCPLGLPTVCETEEQCSNENNGNVTVVNARTQVLLLFNVFFQLA